MGLLDWEKITALLSDPDEGPFSHPFELQLMECGERIYTSYIGTWVWKALVYGLPEPQSSASEASVRNGWHFCQNETQEWAVLTPAAALAVAPSSPMPWVELTPPPVVYGIAIDWRLIEEVILNRQYPRPETCVDAIRTILQVWDVTSRDFSPTLLTINGVPGVLL